MPLRQTHISDSRKRFSNGFPVECFLTAAKIDGTLLIWPGSCTRPIQSPHGASSPQKSGSYLDVCHCPGFVVSGFTRPDQWRPLAANICIAASVIKRSTTKDGVCCGVQTSTPKYQGCTYKARVTKALAPAES